MSGIPDSSLFDIAPSSAIVSAGGKRHQVQGVPFRVFLKIGMLWPPLLKLLSGGQIAAEEFAQAPGAVAEFIAAGFGLAGNEKAIAKAGELELTVQMDLFAAILKQTLGGGSRPFAEKMEAIGELMRREPETSTQTSSPPSAPNLASEQKNVKTKVSTPLPKSSNSSSPTVTSMEMKSGN